MSADGALLEVRLETLQVALDQVCELDRIGGRAPIEDLSLEIQGSAELRSGAPGLPAAALLVPDVVRAPALEDAIRELPGIQEPWPETGMDAERLVEIGAGALLDPRPILSVPDHVPVAARV